MVVVILMTIPAGIAAPGFTRVFDLVLYTVLLVLLAGVYVINRRGHFTAAASGVIILTTAGVLLAGLPYQPAARIQWLDYLVIPIILCIILFSVRTAAAISLAIMGSTFFLPVFIPGFDLLTLIFGPLTFNAAVAALLLVMRWFINNLEADRRAQLLASEERLRRSEQNYRQLVELSPAPILIYDGTTVRYVNSAAVELFGAASAAEVVGKTVRDLIHPDYLPVVEYQIETVLRYNESFHAADRKLLRLDGGTIDVEAAGSLIMFDNRPALQVVYKNITHHKQQAAVERQRRLSAELLRDTAAALNSTLVLSEVFQRILRYAMLLLPHDAARIMLIESDVAYEVEARGYDNHPADMPPAQLALDTLPHLPHLLETGEALVFSDVSASPYRDVLPGWVRSHADAPLIVEDKVIGFICLDSAITGALQSEHVRQLQTFADQASSAVQNALHYEQMRQSNNLLEEYVEERTAELSSTRSSVETILNSTRDAIILVRSNGRIEQVNPAFSHLFGYTAGDVYARKLADLADTTGEAALAAAITNVITSGQPARLEVLMCHQNGKTFTADALLAPAAASPRQPGMIVCSLRDISAQKQIQLELMRALEHERELSELKTRFTTTVSHEFRTPLSAILSSSDILKRYYDRLSDERRQEHLTTIQTYVRRMADMIEDTLIMARSQAVGLNYNPIPVEVDDFFRRLVTEFWETFDTAHQLVYHVTGVPGDLMGDRRLLHRMVSNLLSNAVKYSPNGSTVYISLDCQPEQVQLSVRDEGIGIPPEEIGHIFDMFFRASNTSAVSGTGLGLPIVKEVVSLHGGQVQAANAAGQGTIFTITLPRRLPAGQT